MESSNEEQFSNYLNLLSRLCHNCSKLGVFKMIVSEDSDSDSDEDEIKDSSVTRQEIEVLLFLIHNWGFHIGYFNSFILRFLGAGNGNENLK